jgi:outer membrane receptor protein involved in Fe transport
VLAIQGCDDQGPGSIDWDVPEVSFSSAYSNLGGGTGQVQTGPFDTTFFDPTMTWIKGKHTIKFGGGYLHYFTNSTNGQSPRGTFTFNGKWTGNALADLLLGLPYQASKIVIADEPPNVFYYAHMNAMSAFVQDDYRVSSHLTLNLGLRYEIPFPGTEARDHLANVNLSNGVANAVLEIAGQNGIGSQLYHADYKEFSPRFGFAYTPRNKWVVRGGYGIFYQQVLESTNRTLHNDPPFQSTYTIVGDGKDITINNALVSGLVANVPSFSGFSQYMKGGMVQQFSVDSQHELWGGLFLDVGYVGNRGRDINNNLAYNVPPPGPGAVQARRINPNYATISLDGPATTSEYNGFEARLEKRLSKGMQFLLSYTYSRAFDNSGTAQNPQDIAAQWGPSGYDTPNHVAFSYIYHLPVGRGLKYLNNMNRVGNAVLGGWQFNGIYQYHSGLPFTPILPIDNTNTQVNSDRPNLIGNPYQSTATCQTGTPTCWVNAAAFATPAKYTFGTAGQNELRGPAFSQLDFAMAKNFALGEKRRLEFRAEAFNVLNHVNFDNPIATLSTSFGIITTAEPSRQLQFGARFIF